ncbi:hypothetical protein SAE02_61680 [Skermanella aerolata]|uniref:Uncharacterized protein n=1 Tax=Skermanella aerolata TaxID=393310 RepID=A0A512E0Q2_9PROT|nr:hypothetical protein SAE02_61680 [Skermanella aerolata]
MSRGISRARDRTDVPDDRHFTNRVYQQIRALCGPFTDQELLDLFARGGFTATRNQLNA